MQKKFIRYPILIRIKKPTVMLIPQQGLKIKRRGERKKI